MRLLFLIDSLVPGGAERSLVELAKGLALRDVTVEVATLHARPGLEPELAQNGITVSALGGESRFLWLRRAYDLVRDRRPDLVHTSLFEADVLGRTAARGARVPVVSSLVTETYGAAHLSDPSVRHLRVRAAQLLDATTARAAVRMHAVSEHVARTMARHLHYPEHRIDVVHRGRDLEALGRRTPPRRSAARAALGVDDDERVVLAVGSQEYQKGLDVLVHAVPDVIGELPRMRLFVAGRPGNQSPELQGLVATLGLEDRVTFLGARDDVPDLLCAADLFVLASRREGFPGSVVEAMAMEVPIVTTDLAQIREVTGDECGPTVPSDDVGALARAVVHALTNHDPQRISRARERVEARFSNTAMVDGMLAFYSRALDVRG